MIIQLKDIMKNSELVEGTFGEKKIIGQVYESKNKLYSILADKSLYSNSVSNVALIKGNELISDFKLVRPYKFECYDSGHFLILDLHEKDEKLDLQTCFLLLYDENGKLIFKEKSLSNVHYLAYHNSKEIITYHINNNLVIVGTGKIKSKVTVNVPFIPSNCIVDNNILKIICPDYLYYTDYNIDLIKMYEYFNKKIPFID